MNGLFHKTSESGLVRTAAFVYSKDNSQAINVLRTRGPAETETALITLALLVVCALWCSGCGSGSHPTIPTITITPKNATVPFGGQQQFSATVSGINNMAVTWSFFGTSSAQINASGLFLAPIPQPLLGPSNNCCAGTFQVIATSVADASLVATANVRIPVYLTVTPATVNVATQGIQTFIPTVLGTNTFGVTWTVQEGSAGGSISGEVNSEVGDYVAPNTLGIFHVVATSVGTPQGNFTATVNVVPAVHFSGNMVASRSGHTATLLPNGKVLIAGGCCDNNNNVLSSAELYDPGTGQFTATGNMTVPRMGHTATLLKNGKVLVIGMTFNAHGGCSSNPAELYDPALGTFTATGSLVDLRCQQAATLLQDGRVLVTGGIQGTLPTPPPPEPGEIYDPATGSFALTKGTMVQGLRYGHTAALLQDGRVLIAGGSATPASNQDVTAITGAEIYDPTADTFSATGDMVGPHFGHTATLLQNGKVLITGGMVHAAALEEPRRQVSGTSELFDPSAGTFAATAGQMLIPRNQHAAALLPNGKVILAGGISVYSLLNIASGVLTPAVYAMSVDLYDPTADSFTPTLYIHAPRLSLMATVLPDGSVLLVGGGPIQAELYP